MEKIEKKILGGEKPIVLYLPPNVVGMDLVVHMLDEDNHLFSAMRKMHVEEVIEARIEGWEWEDANSIWEVNPELVGITEEEGRYEI